MELPSKVTGAHWLVEHAQESARAYNEQEDGFWILFFEPDKIDAAWTRWMNQQCASVSHAQARTSAGVEANPKDPHYCILFYCGPWKDNEDEIMQIGELLKDLFKDSLFCPHQYGKRSLYYRSNYLKNRIEEAKKAGIEWNAPRYDYELESE